VPSVRTEQLAPLGERQTLVMDGIFAKKWRNSGTNCFSFLNTRNEPSVAHLGRLGTPSPGWPMIIIPVSCCNNVNGKTDSSP